MGNGKHSGEQFYTIFPPHLTVILLDNGEMYVPENHTDCDQLNKIELHVHLFDVVQRTVYERDLLLDVPQRVTILNSWYKAVCDNIYQFCSPYCKSEPGQDCSVIDEDTLDAAVAQNIKRLKQIKEIVKFCQDAIITPIT